MKNEKVLNFEGSFNLGKAKVLNLKNNHKRNSGNQLKTQVLSLKAEEGIILSPHNT